ncbi:30S ribosomal protein S24e [Methanospirillum hungatei]|jgi:small subunit ribosomal protein S24e|uniref:30S ribosomal protein S24e n=1 Tax=Methanospirillum hungatei TaxID=2203 RepID=UPI0009D38BB3|nr:30S ribosomal protein S24e [Methanospirillum hungatei]MBP7034417.1 30S ribosomal protein S24e [Methanospirillum sp.]MBP9007934.1 30S ribosomal protein S24e [Methanospirillum sp.]OQA59575.1 MAG: 30S ribosomal protein S24e [Euryarchaeota archaeon ADurb.Bin294]HOW04697.1 30S ribosomal protein S24e [Methanospirillum hungatei]
MEITITSQTENVLLNRKEIGFSITFTGATPSRKMVHAKLAAMLNAPKDQLVIGSLHNRFGLTEITGDARVYTSAEYLKKIEPEYIRKRGMAGEEEGNADAQDAPSGDAAEAS